MHPNDTTNEIPYGYCHCGCGEKTRLAPRTHSKLGIVKGEPLRFIGSHASRRDLVTRFWEKVDVCAPDECWEWNAARARRGYGRFRLNGKKHQASRIAYELATGISPGALEVCHKCDNPACCNPNHLFLGTRSENMIDCRDKGRDNRPVGEDSGKSKLTENSVRSIRAQAAQKRRYRDIAQEFGITKENVSTVVRRLTWKHVT